MRYKKFRNLRTIIKIFFILQTIVYTPVIIIGSPYIAYIASRKEFNFLKWSQEKLF